MFYNCRIKTHNRGAQKVFSCKSRCYKCREQRSKSTKTKSQKVPEAASAASAASAVKPQNLPTAATADRNVPEAPSAAKLQDVSGAGESHNVPASAAAVKPVRFSQYVQQRKVCERLKNNIAYLRMSLSACLESRLVTTDIENAYMFMRTNGAALMCSAIFVTKEMTDIMNFLSDETTLYGKRGWEPIFNGVTKLGESHFGKGRRQHLKYTANWKEKGGKSPRALWEKATITAVTKLLRKILPKDFVEYFLEHTLIRSLMSCSAQPWHFDQGFPGSERFNGVGDNNCPFVIIIGLEEYSFLDLVFNGKQIRVCLAKGDVLLVRAECLHRGTEFTFSEDPKKTQHLRGHVYVFPCSFPREKDATYLASERIVGSLL